MKFIKEENGQASDVFRLMIDAIIGLVILVMILATINYFGSLRQQISISEMRGMVEGAVQTPTGMVLESKTLAFSEGEGYSGELFEQWTGLPAKCFSFQSRIGTIKVVDGQGGGVIFNSNVDSKVYMRCKATGKTCDYGDAECIDCEIECLVSFGTKSFEDD
jgi:hypothetical protein